jgi:hypothetical protein
MSAEISQAAEAAAAAAAVSLSSAAKTKEALLDALEVIAQIEELGQNYSYEDALPILEKLAAFRLPERGETPTAKQLQGMQLHAWAINACESFQLSRHPRSACGFVPHSSGSR